MHCRQCRYSEGDAQEPGGVIRLALWCTAKGGQAIEVCENFAAMEEGMAERDPYGRNPHEAGAKLDHGKRRDGLVLGGFARALKAVSDVGTYGAQKYTPNGWMAVPNGVELYTDAMYRHVLSEAAGETLDPDTQILHAAHAAWNALARLDLMLREQEGAAQ